MNKSKRNSNIELLRIVSTLLIIAHHFAVHGGFAFGTTLSFNSLYIHFLNFGGKIGVNCFILISGYFLVKSNRLEFRKLLLLWIKLFVYSVSLFAVFCKIGKLTFTWQLLIEFLLPVTSNYWWFITTYIVLYLFHPFINAALHNLSKKAYVAMLLIMLALWSVVPTVIGERIEAIQFSRFVWFVFLYCVAGYIRLYGLPKKLNATALLLLAIGSYVIIFGLSIVLFVLLKSDVFFNEMETLQMLVPSVFLFCAFAYAKPRDSKFVNVVAASMFGVYLLHEHGMTTRHLIWETLFHGGNYANSPYLVLYSIFAIVAIFTACLAIDLAYNYTVELLLKKVLNTTNGKKLCDKLTLTVEPIDELHYVAGAEDK